MESSSIKRLKLEELLLLLIRILIFLFLVILFANPVTKGFLPSWLVSDQDSITIFVIDNSASMNVLKDENSVLDQVKKEITSLIPLFNNQSNILVYQTCPPKQVFKGVFNSPLDYDQKRLFASPTVDTEGSLRTFSFDTKFLIQDREL